MFVVGLTGGIASGKSTAGRLFEELGAHVIDADVVAREVVAKGSAGLQAVVNEFGSEVLDATGEMDRKAMRDRVFADPEALAKLEAILHPLISTELARQTAEADGPYCILMVPLLIEKGLGRQLIHRIAVVDCDPKQQMARVVARDGGSEEQARAILAAQADRETRLAAADDVISNTAGLGELTEQVELLHRQYLQLSRNPVPSAGLSA